MYTPPTPSIESLRNRQAIRWYVLTLPPRHRDAAKRLQAEANRRQACGERVFEYFAPVYIKTGTGREGGRFEEARLPLLYNYVFVHASEDEIRALKRRLPEYSFLPLVKSASVPHYPYLSDEVMANVRWIARIYAGQLPAYTPDLSQLTRGDRVRITGGRFAGLEATVVRTAGTTVKEVVVCMDDWMWVPLLHIKPEQCEPLPKAAPRPGSTLRCDDERCDEGLYQALLRQHQGHPLTESDRALAAEVIGRQQQAQAGTTLRRCQRCALLLMAYTVLDNRQGLDEQQAEAARLLTAARPDRAHVLLAVAIAACTGSTHYIDLACTLTAPWQHEARPKRHQRTLLERIGQLQALTATR